MFLLFVDIRMYIWFIFVVFLFLDDIQLVVSAGQKLYTDQSRGIISQLLLMPNRKALTKKIRLKIHSRPNYLRLNGYIYTAMMPSLAPHLPPSKLSFRFSVSVCCWRSTLPFPSQSVRVSLHDHGAWPTRCVHWDHLTSYHGI